MITFLLVILILMYDITARIEENDRERMHEELLDTIKKKPKSNRRTVTRNYAKDRYGNVLAQEIIKEGYEEDYNYDIHKYIFKDEYGDVYEFDNIDGFSDCTSEDGVTDMDKYEAKKKWLKSRRKK